MRSELALILFIATTALGCSDAPEADETSTDKKATATLMPTTNNMATGTMTFTALGDQVRLIIGISNVEPSSVHGFHLHEGPDCGADGMAAGAHWDPTMSMPHGQASSGMHHLGDIGNITAKTDGTGQIEIMTGAWSVGTGAANDVVGRAAVLHADADDYTSQPAGNAGSRIACGTVRLAQ